MKKNGFVLIETLIATTLIAVVFTVLYIEFGIINDNYKKTYNNNTVEKIYAANNIKNFLLANEYDVLTNSDSYVDITNCNSFTNQSYCQNLMNVLEVKQVVFFPGNGEAFSDFYESQPENTSQEMTNFVYSCSYNYEDSDVDVIIAEFNDGQMVVLSTSDTLGKY